MEKEENLSYINGGVSVSRVNEEEDKLNILLERVKPFDKKF